MYPTLQTIRKLSKRRVLDMLHSPTHPRPKASLVPGAPKERIQNQPSDTYFCHPKTEPHPKPSSKRIENVSFATLVGHLKGGVHDRPFKQRLTSAFRAKPFKQHPRAWVGEGGTSLRIPETAAHPKPSSKRVETCRLQDFLVI
jgi:hypothetical protein